MAFWDIHGYSWIFGDEIDEHCVNLANGVASFLANSDATIDEQWRYLHSFDYMVRHGCHTVSFHPSNLQW
jgi:hypothetical protein